MTQGIDQIQKLLHGLDDRVPRYTSYPSADRFRTDVGEAHYQTAVRESNRLPLPLPLSIYLHVPFCESLCYYCGCNKVITRDFRKTVGYFDVLVEEIAWHGELFDRDRRVDQLHLGGGTPTYLSDTQLRRLLDVLARELSLEVGDNREFSIELDPRTVGPSRAANLLGMGFNRFSLGIQDFDEQVQQRINRIQPHEMVEALVRALRRQDISLSFDLIYGLPHQNTRSFSDTIEKTIALEPDRLAIYRYAHLPNRFKSQRLLEEDRPELDERLRMFAAARARLLEAGYVAIGLDHFAKPEDELAVAWKDGNLHRNFQGYSTRGGRDLIGIGPSAIGFVGNCYVQNAPLVKDWSRRIGEGSSAIVRGFVLDADDRMRSGIIQDIMCRGRVDLEAAAARYGLHWDTVFEAEAHDLGRLAQRNLIKVNGSQIMATETGKLALRQIAKVFDRYLREGNRTAVYSEAV